MLISLRLFKVLQHISKSTATSVFLPEQYLESICKTFESTSDKHLHTCQQNLSTINLGMLCHLFSTAFPHYFLSSVYFFLLIYFHTLFLSCCFFLCVLFFFRLSIWQVIKSPFSFYLKFPAPNEKEIRRPRRP